MWHGHTVSFELSEQVQEALVLANDEAAARNSTFIRPEDVLLGLLRQGKNDAAVALNELGLTLRVFREAVRARFPYPDMVTMGSLPLHPFTKRALRRARRRGDAEEPIHTADLLLALVENPRRSLVKLLDNLNIRVEPLLALLLTPTDQSHESTVLEYRGVSRRRVWHRLLSGVRRAFKQRGP